MVLDDDSYPAQLQACYPHHNIKFSLMMRRGGLVKVYDSCLMSGSLYKSVLLSDHTSAEELIQLLLHCYNSKEKHTAFALYEVCPSRKYERKLHKDELPLRTQKEWPLQDLYFLQLRYNADEPLQKRKIPWTKSVDSLGKITFRLSTKEDISPTLIHSPTLKPSFNDYENYFYI
ncbi:uncharacterized protein B4U79_02128, partial [Dinothrombium tinctorium]